MPNNQYYYEFMEGFYELLEDPSFLAFLYTVIGIVVVSMLFGVALYIFGSIALYKMAVNRGISNPGLAWIPFIGHYRIGTVADSISYAKCSKSYYGRILLIGILVLQALSLILNALYVIIFRTAYQNATEYYSYGYGTFGDDYFAGEAFANGLESSFAFVGVLSQIIWPVSIAVYVVMMISLNNIYKCYNPQNATAWTVLSVIFPFLYPFFLFSLRNKAPIPEWQPQFYYGNPPPADQNWQMPPPPTPPYEPFAPQQYYQPPDSYAVPPEPAEQRNDADWENINKNPLNGR